MSGLLAQGGRGTGAASTRPPDGETWSRLVDLANEELMSPALFHALRGSDLLHTVPAQVSAELEWIYRRNTERNRNLRSQLVEVAAAFNAIGVSPVVLKGGVHLITAAERDLGRRMMSDIDLLVPEASIGACLEAMDALGYRYEQDLDQHYRDHHHRAPRYRDDAFGFFELHSRVLETAATEILPPEYALRHALFMDVDGARLGVLNPTDRVLHNFVHGQIVDLRHADGRLDLRALDDHRMMVMGQGGEIEWGRLHATFRAYGRLREWRAYCALARKYFDVPMPPGLAPGIGARLHVLRCGANLEWAAYRALDYEISGLSRDRLVQRYRRCRWRSVPLLRLRYTAHLGLATLRGVLTTGRRGSAGQAELTRPGR